MADHAAQIIDPDLKSLIKRLKALDTAMVLHTPTASAIPDDALRAVQGEWTRVKKAIVRRAPKDNHDWRNAVPPDRQILVWNIQIGETPGMLKGTAPAAAYDHAVPARYIGRNAEGLHQLHYRAARTLRETGTTTTMQGLMIILKDATLATLVFDNDGRDPDLPKNFREVSVWQKAALG